MDPKPIDKSEIVHHDGGTTIVGADAMLYYQALQLRGSIKLYAKTGMLPTRGFSARKMLDAAGRITGKVYKRGSYDQAVEDLTTWAQTMKAGLPITDNRSKPE